jgi:hypothetical protein
LSLSDELQPAWDEALVALLTFYTAGVVLKLQQEQETFDLALEELVTWHFLHWVAFTSLLKAGPLLPWQLH